MSQDDTARDDARPLQDNILGSGLTAREIRLLTAFRAAPPPVQDAACRLFGIALEGAP